MNDVSWIKLSVNIFNNRKIKHLRALSGGNNLILIWIMLLVMAGRCNNGGKLSITPDMPYNAKALATELGFSKSIIDRALAEFEELCMIEKADEFYIISNWDEYQSVEKLMQIREYNRIAQRKHREKVKSSKTSDSDDEQMFSSDVENVIDNVIDLSLTCQPCQDTEEEEGEEEKEKEIHSLTLSRDELKQKYMGGSLGGGVVFISDAQFDSLCEMLSNDELNKYLSIVRDCERSGKKYKNKSHYQAIIDMAKKDRRVTGI